MIALAALFGLLIGLAIGALGGGGSVLAVPVFVYVLGESVAHATTASLLVVVVGALAGGLGHARAGRVCWRHAGSFTAAAVPGIVAGTVAGSAVGGRALITGFALILVVAAVFTWRKAVQPVREGSWEGGGACPPLRLSRDLAAGAGIGFLTGFFGVGGGFLIVPTLAIALAFTMRTAVGTSLAIITGTSLIGLAVHVVAGRGIDVPLTVAMAAACGAGAYAGCHVSARLPQRALGQGFAVMVAVVAAYLLVSAALLGGPPGG
ncbi:MAG: sulfite exporter TauE/SafE family protein [Solirubrobacteraceae bacterium]